MDRSKKLWLIPPALALVFLGVVWTLAAGGDPGDPGAPVVQTPVEPIAPLASAPAPMIRYQDPRPAPASTPPAPVASAGATEEPSTGEPHGVGAPVGPGVVEGQPEPLDPTEEPSPRPIRRRPIHLIGPRGPGAVPPHER